MNSKINTHEHIRRTTPKPTIRRRAKAHLDRTVVRIIPGLDVITEETHINAAIRSGGYPHHITTMDLREAAIRVLVNHLTDIAAAYDLSDYEIESQELDGCDVEVIFLLPSARDAMFLNLVLP